MHRYPLLFKSHKRKHCVGVSVLGTSLVLVLIIVVNAIAGTTPGPVRAGSGGIPKV